MKRLQALEPEICAEYLNDKKATTMTLAYKYHCTPQTIRNILSRNNITLSKTIRKVVIHPTPKEQQAFELLEGYVDGRRVKKMTIREAAKIMGVSHQRVHQLYIAYCEYAGIEQLKGWSR